MTGGAENIIFSTELCALAASGWQGGQSASINQPAMGTAALWTTIVGACGPPSEPYSIHTTLAAWCHGRGNQSALACERNYCSPGLMLKQY